MKWGRQNKRERGGVGLKVKYAVVSFINIRKKDKRMNTHPNFIVKYYFPPTKIICLLFI
jgi:hypothetical protein